MKVRDVDQIEASPQYSLVRSNFSKYIEIPCLEACLALYDLNIFPYSSGCNKVNYDNAHIMIYYDYLSEDNKLIADELIKGGIAKISQYIDDRYLIISFPTTLDDDVEVIKQRFLDIVKRFKYQDVLYGRVEYNEEFISKYFKRFGYDRKYDLTNPEVIRGLLQMFGLYYDEDHNLVWNNEELYQKHMTYLTSQKKEGSK